MPNTRLSICEFCGEPLYSYTYIATHPPLTRSWLVIDVHHYCAYWNDDVQDWTPYPGAGAVQHSEEESSSTLHPQEKGQENQEPSHDSA